jgi:hypothetical protein
VVCQSLTAFPPRTLNHRRKCSAEMATVESVDMMWQATVPTSE